MLLGEKRFQLNAKLARTLRDSSSSANITCVLLRLFRAPSWYGGVAERRGNRDITAASIICPEHTARALFGAALSSAYLARAACERYALFCFSTWACATHTQDPVAKVLCGWAGQLQHKLQQFASVGALTSALATVPAHGIT